MPKILRVLNRLNIGGPTYNVAYLSKYISKEFQTKIYAGNIEPDEGSSEYVLRQLGMTPTYIPTMFRSINLRRDYKAYKFIRKAIKEFQPDIVHTHAAKAGMLGRLAAYHEKVPIIVHTFHGNVFDGYFGTFKSFLIKHVERFLSSISTRIIAISYKQKSDLVNKYNIATSKKVVVIPLGFDLEKFKQNTEMKRHKFRSEFFLDENTLAIGIIGRLTLIKNHDLFLQVINKVRGVSNKKIRAFIIGDGEEKSELIQKALNFKMTFSTPDDFNPYADIIFTSWRKDIDVVNAGLDIIALTSFNEGTPVCLIEAMASEKPIISTKVGGIEDIIESGINGVLCETEVNDFSKKLLDLIDDDKLRTNISKKASKGILERYSYLRLVSDIENLYLELLKEHCLY